jgi:two-component system, NtrC family, response regulator AtoC
LAFALPYHRAVMTGPLASRGFPLRLSKKDVPIVQGDVLIVEPEPSERLWLSGLLVECGYSTVAVGLPLEALAALERGRFVFSVVNLDLGSSDSVEFIEELKSRAFSAGPIIVIYDRLSAKRISEASAHGAESFIQKPFRLGELKRVVADLRLASTPLTASPDQAGQATRLGVEIALWQSPRMQEVCKIIEQASLVDITILITGETGTGKDLVARAIHHLSARRVGPLVKVNCAAVPRELLESELFGHERGAFTGAHQLKVGKFEAANGGTIFLDEIGDLHPGLQAKLLHVLQDGTFSRVGGRSTIRADVRIIAATNQDLEAAVIGGRFREDLFYRLNVIQIEVPPLRERSEEIPLLIDYFRRRYSRLYRRDGFTITPDAVERLVNRTYQGNVRELENIVKRMIVLNDPMFSRVSLPRQRPEGGPNGRDAGSTGALSLRSIAREAAVMAERQTISRALDQTRWNRVQAAKLLDISYRALLYKIKRAGLAAKRATAGSSS